MSWARWLMVQLGQLARRKRLCYAIALLAPLPFPLECWRQARRPG
jgi:hypothetical protein